MEDPVKLFILLFLLIVNFPLFSGAESHPTVLYVGGSGEGTTQPFNKLLIMQVTAT